MKFLDTSSLKFEFFVDLPTSEYAIFSHGSSTQLETPAESIDERVLRACDEAKARNIRYLWSHDLCTRQNSLEDATEFANSSFRLAWNARVCLVYLYDLLPKNADSHKRTVQGDLSKCTWFTQMWNIQHLVAAQDVEFFDHHWNLRGTKASGSWPGFLSHASGIDESVLANRNSLFGIPIGRRLPWSSQRQTSRPEDVAYAMTGICEIALTPRYGEGGRAAFQRLEEKLFKKTGDSSILTWRKQSDSRAVSMRHAPVRPQIYPPKRHSKRSMDVMLQQDQAMERCSQGDDVLLLDTLPDKPRRLADHHPYHSLVLELATIGLKAWEEEKGSAAGLGRSENSASVHNHFTLSFRPRKRARRGRQLEDHSTSHSDGSCTVETDSSDSDTMVVVQHRTHANASHLLACPFYRLEPARFHSCLWELEIHDMRTLKQHLIVDHHLPDYCPVCYETFDNAAGRDTHIVARSCSSREVPAGMMRGVSEDQVEKLSRSYVERGRMTRDVSRRRSRPRQRRTITSEEQEWRSVWDILFPTAPQPHSIYLSERYERKVVSLREFWHKVGPAMIANILKERGMRRWEDANEESDLEALFGSVLASMMESLS